MSRSEGNGRGKAILAEGWCRFGLALMILGGLAVRLHFARFFYLPSDIVQDYYPAVNSLLGSEGISSFSWDSWHVRLGLIIPLALVEFMVGSPVVAISLAGFLFSTVQIFLVYKVGCELWDKQVGLLAGFLQVVYPMSVMFGANVLPDTLMAPCITASFLFFFKALRTRSTRWLLASGIAAGLGYTMKITALFVIPLMLFLWLWKQRKGRESDLLLFVGGVGVVVLVETVILCLLANGFTFRPLSILTASSEGSLAPVITWERYFPGFFRGLFWPLDSGFPYHGFFPLIGLGIAAWSLVTSADSKLRSVVGWWMGLLLMANFACLGFSRPVFLFLQMRGLMFTVPAVVLMIAFSISTLVPVRRLVAILGLTISSLGFCHLLYSTWQPYDESYRQVVTQLKQLAKPRSTIFFPDAYSSQCVGMLMNDSRTYLTVGATGEISGAEKGDLAVVIISGYQPEEDLLPNFVEEIHRDSWTQVVDWRSNLGISHMLLEWFNIPVKKGLRSAVKIYHYRGEAIRSSVCEISALQEYM